MAAMLGERVRLGAQVITLRLRLSSMLRRSSLSDLLESLTPPSVDGVKAPLDAAASALSAAEALVSRVPAVPNTCLYRALARYAVLRSAGHPARFVMALDPSRRDAIEGHAWVELDGSPFGEVVDPNLIVTYTYPSRSSRPPSSPAASLFPAP